jgi:hypothetical protein
MKELSIEVVFVGLKTTISINPSGYICSYYSMKHSWGTITLSDNKT